MRTRALAVLLLLLVAALVALALAYSQRRAVAEELIRRAAAAWNVAPLEFRVAHVGRRAIALHDVRVGDPADLVIGRLVVRYEPRELSAGQLRAVELEGLELRAGWNEDGLTLGALDPLLAGGEASDRSPLPPVERLVLRDGRLALETPYGPLTARVDGRAARGGGSLAGTVSLTVLAEALDLSEPALHAERVGVSAEAMFVVSDAGLRLELERCASASVDVLELRGGFVLTEPLALCIRAPEGALAELGFSQEAPTSIRLELAPAELGLRLATAQPGQISGTTPTLRVRVDAVPGQAPQLAIEAAGGRFELPDAELHLEGLDAKLALAGSVLAGPATFHIGRVSDLSRTARFAPIELRAAIEPGDEAYRVEASVHGVGQKLLAYRGQATLAPAATHGDLSLEPLRFERKGLQPRTLSPAFGGQAREVSGTLSGRGWLDFQAERAEPLDFRLDLLLEGLAAATAGGTAASGLSGSVRLLGPLPVRTPAGQRLTFAEVNGGLPFTDGEVRFQLTRGSVLEIEDARWRYAGGTLRTAGRVDYAAAVQALVVEAVGLDVATLIDQLDLDALSGDGRLDGTIPLEQRGERVLVKSAELRATEPGVLRYAGAAQIPGTAGQLAALEDFRYERLELTLDGDLDGAAVIAVKLRGHNPAYQNGRPVVLNVNVDADLGDLLRGARSATLVPEVLQKRLRDRVDSDRE